MPDTLLTDELVARGIAPSRPLLTGDRTYYVRKDGSDANTGLANSAGVAKLTVQAALDAAAKIDFNGFRVTVQLGDGTYTERLLIPKMVGQKGTDQLTIRGNVTTPANTVIRQTGGYSPTVEAIFGAMVTVAAFKVEAPNNGYGLNAAEAGVINVSGGMIFGDCTGGYHIYSNNGGTINGFNPYTISGNANAHFCVGFAGNGYVSTAITIASTITVTFGFMAAITNGSLQCNGCTFVNPGNVTGPRYATQKCGTIETFGAGATYLPGTVAGSSSGGGQYG